MTMMEQIMNMKEETSVKVEMTSNVRFRTPDGMIFTSRDEYLDYVRGLRD